MVKRSMLMTLAGRDPGISRELLTLSGSEAKARSNPYAVAG